MAGWSALFQWIKSWYWKKRIMQRHCIIHMLHPSFWSRDLFHFILYKISVLFHFFLSFRACMGSDSASTGIGCREKHLRHLPSMFDWQSITIGTNWFADNINRRTSYAICGISSDNDKTVRFQFTGYSFLWAKLALCSFDLRWYLL